LDLKDSGSWPLKTPDLVGGHRWRKAIAFEVVQNPAAASIEQDAHVNGVPKIAIVTGKYLEHNN